MYIVILGKDTWATVEDTRVAWVPPEVDDVAQWIRDNPDECYPATRPVSPCCSTIDKGSLLG